MSSRSEAPGDRRACSTSICYPYHFQNLSLNHSQVQLIFFTVSFQKGRLLFYLLIHRLFTEHRSLASEKRARDCICISRFTIAGTVAF